MITQTRPELGCVDDCSRNARLHGGSDAPDHEHAYMFYAPNVSDADIGGHGFSKQYPFVLRMSPGRDDYIITLVGEAEKAKILADSKDLLDELCSYRERVTLPQTFSL